MVLAAGAAHAQTINILMESVPDTRLVQEVLPQFTELRDLARLARDEEEKFFVRNPHLVSSYRDGLIAAALCQSVALHFLGRGCGVADFDVHLFYCQNPAWPRLSRTIKRATADVGRFNRVPVDFVRTVVPAWLWPSPFVPNTEDILRTFLKQQPTNRAHHLAKKAVVLPDALFGRVIWG